MTRRGRFVAARQRARHLVESGGELRRRCDSDVVLAADSLWCEGDLGLGLPGLPNSTRAPPRSTGDAPRGAAAEERPESPGPVPRGSSQRPVDWLSIDPRATAALVPSARPPQRPQR